MIADLSIPRLWGVWLACSQGPRTWLHVPCSACSDNRWRDHTWASSSLGLAFINVYRHVLQSSMHSVWVCIIHDSWRDQRRGMVRLGVEAFHSPPPLNHHHILAHSHPNPAPIQSSKLRVTLTCMLNTTVYVQILKKKIQIIIKLYLISLSSLKVLRPSSFHLLNSLDYAVN